jgi:DNA repair and recombination RAD54-like protein
VWTKIPVSKAIYFISTIFIDDDLLLGCAEIYPPSFNENNLDPSFSGKMKVLDYLLAITRKTTKDKFVLVSNYTETLNAFVEVSSKLKFY